MTLFAAVEDLNCQSHMMQFAERIVSYIMLSTVLHGITHSML